MVLKSNIMPHLTAYILSEERQKAQRRKFERHRLKTGAPHVVEFFHDPSDPYSQLLDKVLPEFQAKYQIDLATHIVGLPDDSAVPERKQLTEYAKVDAMRLSKKAGIDFEIQNHPPAHNTGAADLRLKNLGHYLGGTLYYGGEWYWGLDRLHYLEERLKDLGATHENGAPSFIYKQPDVPNAQGHSSAEIHWYLSFRSPYTALVKDRIKSLAEAYGATLKPRIVLPMVMRSLPIPPTKKKYIPLDAAREARRLGIRFGRIFDPVGKPVERGYSLVSWAREQGRDYEFVHAFLRLVWSEGVDPGNDAGMRKIVEEAGLSWNDAKNIVGNEDWQDEAEANRTEMRDHGIWGVPSFRVGKTITWGQDRLWVVEHALQKKAGKDW